MNNENPTVQMRKGILEYCILLVFANTEKYASDLIDILKAANLIVVEGTLYPLLNRLQKSGYLNYQWKESSSGPPRKYYMLTHEGENYLKTLNETWLEMSASIEKLKQLKEQNHA